MPAESPEYDAGVSRAAVLGLAVMACACACHRRAGPAAPPAAGAGVEPCGSRVERDGIVVENVTAAGACVTLVRVDPARFALRLLTARAHGGRRTPSEWARDYGLVG